MTALFEKEYNYSNEPIHDLEGCRYDVILKAYTNFRGANEKVVRYWNGLRFVSMMRFQWYFRRIAAIYQINNPREVCYFLVSRSISEIDTINAAKVALKNKITSAKAKITQAESELSKLRAGWNEIFAIEDHPKWDATYKKLLQKKTQLALMEQQYLSM